MLLCKLLIVAQLAAIFIVIVYLLEGVVCSKAFVALDRVRVLYVNCKVAFVYSLTSFHVMVFKHYLYTSGWTWTIFLNDQVCVHLFCQDIA